MTRTRARSRASHQAGNATEVDVRGTSYKRTHIQAICALVGTECAIIRLSKVAEAYLTRTRARSLASHQAGNATEVDVRETSYTRTHIQAICAMVGTCGSCAYALFRLSNRNLWDRNTVAANVGMDGRVMYFKSCLCSCLYTDIVCVGSTSNIFQQLRSPEPSL